MIGTERRPRIARIVRNARIWLAIAALVLGIAAAFARTPTPDDTAAAARRPSIVRPGNGC
jgi:hypothetical protein